MITAWLVFKAPEKRKITQPRSQLLRLPEPKPTRLRSPQHCPPAMELWGARCRRLDARFQETLLMIPAEPGLTPASSAKRLHPWSARSKWLRELRFAPPLALITPIYPLDICPYVCWIDIINSARSSYPDHLRLSQMIRALASYQGFYCGADCLGPPNRQGAAFVSVYHSDVWVSAWANPPVAWTNW